jgi:3-deoxy-manno-octulosonate cytidylyltransferase (CMP-KDO synthetase)
VLADIGGRTMLDRVHEVATRSGADRVLVLTDNEEVAAEARSFGAEVMMTSPECESGTARIVEVAPTLDTDLVIDFQGDAPMVDPAILDRMAEEAERSGAPVTMPVYRMQYDEDVLNPNVVKVLRTHEGRVLYCSRSPVPHVRDATEGQWVDRAPFWGHPGLYGFRRDFLLRMHELPPSPLDRAERLEQLQWIEAGVHVHSFEVPPQGPSVDTPQELDRVRAAFAAMELERR